MTLYRALKMGTLPGDIRVREGETFEFAGQKGAWMEKVDAEAPTPSEPEAVVETESAEPAESKRKPKRRESE